MWDCSCWLCYLVSNNQTVDFLENMNTQLHVQLLHFRIYNNQLSLPAKDHIIFQTPHLHFVFVKLDKALSAQQTLRCQVDDE